MIVGTLRLSGGRIELEYWGRVMSHLQLLYRESAQILMFIAAPTADIARILFSIGFNATRR